MRLWPRRTENSPEVITAPHPHDAAACQNPSCERCLTILLDTMFRYQLVSAEHLTKNLELARAIARSAAAERDRLREEVRTLRAKIERMEHLVTRELQLR